MLSWESLFDRARYSSDLLPGLNAGKIKLNGTFVTLHDILMQDPRQRAKWGMSDGRYEIKLASVSLCSVVTGRRCNIQQSDLTWRDTLSD